MPDYILLDIILPQLPPSLNSLYPTNKQGRRVKSEAGEAFEEHTAQLVQLENPGFVIQEGAAYEFFLVCYFPEPTGKSDMLYKSDADNRLKAAIDSIFASSRLDEVTLTKADDNSVFGGYFAKRRGTPQMLARHPKGYSRVVLAYSGFMGQVLESLETL